MVNRAAKGPLSAGIATHSFRGAGRQMVDESLQPNDDKDVTYFSSATGGQVPIARAQKIFSANPSANAGSNELGLIRTTTL